MDNRAGEMQVFVRVAEAGSFSDAARQLLMTPSTVSKLIARMEQRIGVRLIERSTRRLSLTDEGRIFHERSLALLGELDAIEREISKGAVGASGAIRINASVAFGALGIEPLLPEFWALYPNIVVDLSLSDEIIDLYLDRTDIAFRIGALPDSTLRAQSLGTTKRRIVASPAYLERHGIPETIQDLDHHNCLGFNFRRGAPVWPLRDNGRIVDRMVGGSLLANNGETVYRLALAGMGLARLGDFHVRNDITNGRLIEILTDAGHGDAEEIHALYLSGQRMPQRIRVFLDFAIPRLRSFIQG